MLCTTGRKQYCTRCCYPYAGSYRAMPAWVLRSYASVCLYVRAQTGKRLELSTPNLVHVHSIAVARHVLTQRSKVQGHTVTKTVTVGRTVATDACCNGLCWRGCACRFDRLCFLVVRLEYIRGEILRPRHDLQPPF